MDKLHAPSQELGCNTLAYAHEDNLFAHVSGNNGRQEAYPSVYVDTQIRFPVNKL
jgi:hypothetical protein